jgi:hypothetical protein
MKKKIEDTAEISSVKLVEKMLQTGLSLNYHSKKTSVTTKD